MFLVRIHRKYSSNLDQSFTASKIMSDFSCQLYTWKIHIRMKSCLELIATVVYYSQIKRRYQTQYMCKIYFVGVCAAEICATQFFSCKVLRFQVNIINITQ